MCNTRRESASRWRSRSALAGLRCEFRKPILSNGTPHSDATSPILRHFQELKSAPRRASGSAYACSATKALAGDGPIAVPHTAAQDDKEQVRIGLKRERF